ncbi:protein NEN4 [Punica granatum]|uniref:Protein NEN4 n=2 Tax=Punica granatum TaxID=22663 RepID=A0A6P8DQX2_PUNGR|nr:protein NEN4 [Punica granatum]PKI58714.1 hypothetical protein CRG98_020870 [Punica granatum]
MDASGCIHSWKSHRTEIVFFDLETTVPRRTGQGFSVLEFGAIVVCPWKLVELESYTTLIRPKDLSMVALRSGRRDGITRDAVADAPTFEEVADKIFNILNGRVWAGHNIQRFDCIRIKEAFAATGRAPPSPVGVIDSLGVLTEKFGRRAGNMKMETLAAYFGLGQQKHRSLDDVRMNLEVVKHCATVLFLESSLPRILVGKWHPSSSIITRSRSHNNHGKLPSRTSSLEESVESMNTNSRKSPPASTSIRRPLPYSRGTSLGKMTEGVKNLLNKAQQGSQPLTNLLKHSHSLLR